MAAAAVPNSDPYAIGRIDRLVITHRSVPLEEGFDDFFSVLDILHAFDKVIVAARQRIL